VVLVGFKLFLVANWLPSLHLACQNRPEMTYKVSTGTLNLYSLTLHFLLPPVKSWLRIHQISVSGWNVECHRIFYSQGHKACSKPNSVRVWMSKNMVGSKSWCNFVSADWHSNKHAYTNSTNQITDISTLQFIQKLHTLMHIISMQCNGAAIILSSSGMIFKNLMIWNQYIFSLDRLTSYNIMVTNICHWMHRCPAEWHSMFVPWTKTRSITAPFVWNSLPAQLHSAFISHGLFSNGLKTHPLFASYLGEHWSDSFILLF